MARLLSYGNNSSNTDVENYPIDFVIPWVDGSDQAWLEEKTYWAKQETHVKYSEWTMGTIRYQDWGLLRYWFRGIEKFTPWYNRVFFITWGHLPKWLNLENERLTVVRHEDYIPDRYLPTFNSRVIELNMHRIAELSEHFVYFNDDTFLLAPMTRTSFFRKGKPRDFAGLEIAHLESRSTSARPMNAMVINDHYSQRDVIKKNLGLWLNPKYGLSTNVKTLCAMPWPFFSSIQRNHLPSNFLKSFFVKAWEIEGEKLDEDCMHKFREFTGVNQWLVRDMQRVEGVFDPIKQYRECVITCKNGPSQQEVHNACSIISRPHAPMVSINDMCSDETSYTTWRDSLIQAFESLLPEPSSFEIMSGGGSFMS